MEDEVREEVQRTGGSSCLLPLIWMVAGNGVLLVMLFVIKWKDSALLSPLSLGFWIVVGLVVSARYLDVTRFNGTKMDGGTPATLRDVKGFGAGLVALAGGGWVLAHTL